MAGGDRGIAQFQQPACGPGGTRAAVAFSSVGPGTGAPHRYLRPDATALRGVLASPGSPGAYFQRRRPPPFRSPLEKRPRVAEFERHPAIGPGQSEVSGRQWRAPSGSTYAAAANPEAAAYRRMSPKSMLLNSARLYMELVVHKRRTPWPVSASTTYRPVERSRTGSIWEISPDRSQLLAAFRAHPTNRGPQGGRNECDL